METRRNQGKTSETIPANILPINPFAALPIRGCAQCHVCCLESSSDHDFYGYRRFGGISQVGTLYSIQHRLLELFKTKQATYYLRSCLTNIWSFRSKKVILFIRAVFVASPYPRLGRASVALEPNFNFERSSISNMLCQKLAKVLFLTSLFLFDFEYASQIQAGSRAAR